MALVEVCDSKRFPPVLPLEAMLKSYYDAFIKMRAGWGIKARGHGFGLLPTSVSHGEEGAVDLSLLGLLEVAVYISIWTPA